MTVLIQRLVVLIMTLLGAAGVEIGKRAAIVVTIILLSAALIATLKLFFESLLNQVAATIPHGEHIAAFFPSSLTTALSVYVSAYIAAWLYRQQIKVIQYRLF